jgi:hypothetical protein
VSDRPRPAYDLEDLGRLLDHAKLLPPGCEAHRATGKDVFWVQPGAQRVAVTTDPEFFEENPESLEFWTPGSPAFPDSVRHDGLAGPVVSLQELLK